MKAISRNVCVAILLSAILSSPSRGQIEANSHRIVPLRPMDQDVEVLYGDPEKAGEPFVIRIRELAGGLIPPHRHPVDEHITVVQGRIFFAVGTNFERASLKELKAGSYAFIPKGSIMFGYTPEAAIVQVHGIGPFHIHWRADSRWQEGLRTLDSPDASTVFRFKRGDHVATPRGSGRIRQGYDSGEIVGYEIDGDNGSLFMAEDCEIEGSARTAVSRQCFTQERLPTEKGPKHQRH